MAGSKRRSLQVILIGSFVAVIGWVFASNAVAAPDIDAVSTSNDYTVVTITFSEDVTLPGGGTFGMGNVVATNAGANVSAASANGAVVTVTFDAAVQPATATIGFTGTNVDADETGVPLAAGDWTNIEATLRAIVLPSAGEVPIALAYMSPDDDGIPTHTFDELLPASMPTSLNLPQSIVITRNANGTFSAALDGSATLATESITPEVVVVASTAGDLYDITLGEAGDPTIDLNIGLGGTIELSTAGAITSGALSLELDAAGTPTLTGIVGFVGLSADTTLSLDASFAFDPASVDPPTDPTETLTGSEVTIDRMTIAGLGVGDTDITVPGDAGDEPLISFDWPQLTEVDTDGVRTEHVVATDNSWTNEGLLLLPNIALTDLVFTPGALGNWFAAAQTVAPFDTDFPVVDGNLGETVGWAQTLAMFNDEIAIAATVLSGPFAVGETARLSGDFCADLEDARVRAEDVAEAIAVVGDFDPANDDLETWQQDVLAAIDGVVANEATIRADFAPICSALFSGIVLDLANGTVETDINVSGVAVDFYTSGDPDIDLAFEGASLGDLNTAVSSADWSGTSTPTLTFRAGLKLNSDTDLLNTNALVVDLVDPFTGTPGAPDEDDVTAAHRIYVPDNATIAGSAVTISGTAIDGDAEAGFLDLTFTGATVSVTPNVSLTTKDPGTGIADGKVDLAELIFAATRDDTGVADLRSVVDVGLVGEDVDIDFTMTNSLMGTNSDIDVVGNVEALFDDGDFIFVEGTLGGPADVASDEIAYAHDFADVLNVSDLSSTDIVAMVADALEQIAENAANGAGDQRIPIVDVTLDEVAGFTEALSEVADFIRDDVPTSVDELAAFVNDALESAGMGAVTVGYTPAAGTDPAELTITLDGNLSESATFPVSFDVGSGDDLLSLAPIDGGAQLDAAVQIDFQPVLGIKLDPDLSITDAVFVRDISARFDAFLSGTIDGSVSVGPLEANLLGSASIGDADLTSGGITAAVTTIGGDTEITLGDFAGNVTVGISGSLPVDLNVSLEIPLLDPPEIGSMTITGSVPGNITTSTNFDIPSLKDLLASIKLDLRTMVTGASETARFIARGADEVSELGDQIPVVGSDIGAGFMDVSDAMDEVADVIDDAIAFLDDDSLVADFEDLINTPLGNACAPITCSVDITLLPDDPDTKVLDADGVEIVLTISGSANATTSATAGLGLEPVLELDIDVTNATADVGFNAAIGLGVSREEGFYLFPGINRTDDSGTLFELYAELGLDTTIDLTLAGLTASADAEISVTGSLNSINGGEAAGLKVDMPGQIAFADLVNRSRSLSETLTPSLEATVTADLPIVVSALQMDLTLPFVFNWEFADTLKPSFETATLDIVDATLDLNSLLQPVGDLVGEVNQYNPLAIDEVDEFLTTEIPLIETTIDEVILDLYCPNLPPTDGTCVAYSTLRSLDDLEAQLSADDVVVNLGSFQIYPTPDEGDSRYTPPDTVIQVRAAAFQNNPIEKLKDLLDEKTGGIMSMPILDEFGFIMGIILGGELTEEVDIIRIEIPEDAPIYLGKSFSFKRELFDLDIAFLEGNLEVSLNGGIGLIVSGGFGYSTRGIQTGNPFDGIFLIDNDTSEIALGAAINASVDGRFSVLGDVASVKFSGSGGFSATAGIDLFDESPVLVSAGGGGDGKLYFDEIDIIADAYNPPLSGLPSEFCMFQLQTIGEWELSFSGKAKVLGITVFNESFDEGGELWNETISCTLRPRIARVEDRQLILHAGPNADDRFDDEGDIDERFEITTDGTDATVIWSDGGKPSLTFPLDSFDVIIADMGDDDDTVTVATAITQPVEFRGGDDDDTFNGGGGDDDARGNDGDDTLNGRAGNDSLNGGPGDDTLNGGTGDDELNGNEDDDTAEFSNGWGEDIWTDNDGTDTLDFSAVTNALEGTTSFGDATVEASDGSVVAYFSQDIDAIIGSSAGDTFEFKSTEPNGFSFDGAGGSDDVTFISGKRIRTVSVTDSGPATDTDTVTVLGTSTADNFLLRAQSTALDTVGTNAFVARIAGLNVDRYDYDDSIEDLTVDGQLSADTFTVDDNAANTHIIGGQGADIVQVGQVYGLANCDGDNDAEPTCADDDSVRDDTVQVASGDEFAATSTTRGHLSKGVTHDLLIDGDDGDDSITIFSNNAPVTANGGEGNDSFVARAFIIAASVQLNGEGGIDDFDYVVNEKLSIDGGPGVDNFTIIGTEADDGFAVDVDDLGAVIIEVCPIDDVTGLPDVGSAECAIDVDAVNIESYAVIGLEGDDVFWIRSTAAAFNVEMSGGQHSDLFLVGDGTLDDIDGPMTASGDQLGDVPAIPDPVVLPGEDTTGAFEPTATGGTNRGDELRIDASQATDDLTGEVTDAAIRGLGMADGPFSVGDGAGNVIVVPEVLAHLDLEFITIETGTGVDDITVTSTHVGNDVCDADGCPLDLITGDGADVIDVQSISGEATLDLGSGADIVNVGQPDTAGDVLDAIDAGLIVLGGDGADTLDLDNTADGAAQIDVDQGLITEAGMDPDGVMHTAVETINLRLGDANDVANVRGTATDAVETHVYGNDGEDRFYVSSTAMFTTLQFPDNPDGHVDLVASELFIHGGLGSNNQLMISDRDATVGDDSVSYDGAALSGLAPATINHDVDGAFGDGITIWTSELDDGIAVTGSDLSGVAGVRTLTVMNTGDGVDDVDVTLAEGNDGPFVLNVEEGDDDVDGSASSLDLIVFGGLGGDTLTTGDGDDIVIGDLATVETADGSTVVGGGGPGDTTDGDVDAIDQVVSIDGGGGTDTITAGIGNDVVYAGAAADTLNGGDDDDLLVGGHSIAGASDVGDTINGDGGLDTIAGDNAVASSPLQLHDVATTLTPAPAGTGGDDTVNGGADNDTIFGQQGNDTLNGEGGDDYVEGNDGEDTISGGADQDDLIGGGSAFDGVIDDDRNWRNNGAGLLDENDEIDGGADADVILGDNGLIDRPGETLADVFGSQNPAYDEVEVRDVQQSIDIDPDLTFGADLLQGGEGPDQLYGQLDTSRPTTFDDTIVIEGDELHGGGGEDALIGDLGSIVVTLEDGSAEETIAPNGPFLEATIRTEGSLTYEVTLYLQQDGDYVDEGDDSEPLEFGAEGDDLLLGDGGTDSIHGGGGDDVANGGAGEDYIFGGDGNDALWGGADNDELFGGHDEDSHDVVPRNFMTDNGGEILGPDPDLWFLVADGSALEGLDIVYGGWNSDEMQADVKSNGPKPADRLSDWAGAYNRYLSCEKGNGAGTFLRTASPSMREFFAELAEGRGAVAATIIGSSGDRELGLVQIEDMSFNAGSVGGEDHVACP